jgi:predicted MFS family arabinose efflux permease
MVVLTTIVQPIGVAVGSVAVGFFTEKMTLRNMLLLANFLAIFANIIKLIENGATILLGRFLFGLCGGVMNFAYGKALNDTVP